MAGDEQEGQFCDGQDVPGVAGSDRTVTLSSPVGAGRTDGQGGARPQLSSATRRCSGAKQQV